MALKPTIYKFNLALSDLDRNYYDSLKLTIACHPSETHERMMVRVAAYCLNASESLSICKGLSDTEEPALQAESLDGSLELWIDVGEPAPDRIKKASRAAAQVRIYCFNTKSTTWFEQNASKLDFSNVSISQFNWKQVQSLAELLRRTMDMSVTINGDSIFFAAEDGEVDLTVQELS